MAELVGNIPDDAVLQAQLDILYGQTPDITIKAHELPEESEPTVEKSGTLAEPVFDIGIPQAMGAVAAREYAKQAETARDAAIVAGETAKEELNGIVASADAALDQKITETGTLLDEKVATAAQRASEAASSAAAAAQKAAAAEQAMQGAQAAQAQAEQSAQEAAENTAMAKDFASGQPVTYSGSPVSIAYAGANRIDALTLYGENVQGGTTEAPVALTGITSVTVNDDVTELPIPRPLHKVGDVRDVCRTRVKSVYDKHIVLDGSEDWRKRTDIIITGGSCFYPNNFIADAISNAPIAVSAYFVGRTNSTTKLWEARQVGSNVGIQFNAPFTEVSDFKAWLAAHPLTVYYQSTAYDGTNGLDVMESTYNVGYIESYAGESITTAWISSTGALSTGAEVAYVLSSPETYATDPLDIDNAAGPLIVMTGGEVEVRMTELVGSRTYDADGDGVVDEAEKVSNALTLKNAAGEVVATFDGSEAAILQLTAALVGALGKTEKAADSSKLAGLAPVVDNPGPNNRNTWYFPFTGTNNRDGTRKYYAALYADNATTAGRASNLSMGLNGTDLWVYYS